MMINLIHTALDQDLQLWPPVSRDLFHAVLMERVLGIPDSCVAGEGFKTTKAEICCRDLPSL